MKINVSVIVVHNQQILLMQRSLTDNYYPGAWGIPGGYMEDVDNSLEDTAKREVLEEMGIAVTPDTIISNNTNKQTNTLYIVYTATPTDAASYPSGIQLSDEVNDFKWATKEDLHKLEFTPFTKERLITVFDKMN